jgi:hypothetical protein
MLQHRIGLAEHRLKPRRAASPVAARPKQIRAQVNVEGVEFGMQRNVAFMVGRQEEDAAFRNVPGDGLASNRPSNGCSRCSEANAWDQPSPSLVAPKLALNLCNTPWVFSTLKAEFVFIGNPGQASAVILLPTVKPNSGSKTTKTPYIQRPAAAQQSPTRIWGRENVSI